MAHLQRRHAGGLGIFRLQTRDQLTAAVTQRALFVEGVGISGCDKPAVARGQRQVARQRARQLPGQRVVFAKPLSHLIQDRRQGRRRIQRRAQLVRTV